MKLREPQGVVERDGDGYVGHCYEVGTSSWGRTVEEAFHNLRIVTWRHLERQATAGAATNEQERQGKAPVYARAD
jgi:hypothetical protein